MSECENGCGLYLGEKRWCIISDITCEERREWLNKHDAEVRRKTLEEFISKAEEERDDILNWDDNDFDVGMKIGYQYSIEIAENMKGETE